MEIVVDTCFARRLLLCAPAYPPIPAQHRSLCGPSSTSLSTHRHDPTLSQCPALLDVEGKTLGMPRVYHSFRYCRERNSMCLHSRAG
ncbi:hypothetical protein Hypma_012604 [Hypsizygus marmoreus]|uniref:Uncharacterized protein n=1 Tax=Hypsizygus marmoreus TaxID=39966 RepID=A0A369JIK6_HYPMA|nr:hypothetical protein Hypma_012604 [Hypsizygus marmoreus]